MPRVHFDEMHESCSSFNPALVSTRSVWIIVTSMVKPIVKVSFLSDFAQKTTSVGKSELKSWLFKYITV